jgi:hypothetical protein
VSKERLQHILELAKWAPSGDNTQPWRFEIVDDSRIRVHGHDTRDHVLYDFQGHASHIAHGALLETMRIAASGLGLSCNWVSHSDAECRYAVYDVAFAEDPAIKASPLLEWVKLRSVQRRPMRTTPLTKSQRGAIEAAAGDALKLRYFDDAAKRLAVARLLWRSAKIRLVCKEAYPVHRDIIEWRTTFSKDRIPERAVGVDPMTARLMEWVMGSWERVSFFNKFLGGTILPRVQLDLLPGLLCGAHIAISPTKNPVTLEDWVHLGIRWQRVWLTISQCGLHMQPEMTPVIFRWYARSGSSFSSMPQLDGMAMEVAKGLEKLTGASPEDPIAFLFRVGTSNAPSSRSVRKDLPELLNGGPSGTG